MCLRQRLEAQHWREKLSMVVQAYSPALEREEAGDLLGLAATSVAHLHSQQSGCLSSISCPAIVRNPLDNTPLQQVCILAHTHMPHSSDWWCPEGLTHSLPSWMAWQGVG